MENSQTKPVTVGLFTVRHWRKDSSSGRCTVAAAIAVEVLEVIVGLLILKVEMEAVLLLYERKKQRKLIIATVIHRIGSLSLPCCHSSSISFLSPPFLFFCFQLPTSTHSLVSSCLIHLPLTHASSLPCSFFSLSLLHLTLAFLVSFLSENSHPFTQSFHFFPLPSIPFVWS